MEGDDKMKVVHRSLLLPLFSHPSDQASDSDKKSMVDQTVSTQVVIVAGAVTSHVHNLSTYSRVWVTNMLQRGLKFVTALFEQLKHCDLLGLTRNWIKSYINVFN